MIPGLGGNLLSHDALAGFIAEIQTPASAATPHAFRVLRGALNEGGPTWTSRHVADRITVPFAEAFELAPLIAGSSSVLTAGSLTRGGTVVAVFVATAWGEPARHVWREAVRLGIQLRVRWCLCFSGPAITVFDAERTHSRRSIELDLASLVTDGGTLAVARHMFGGRGPLRIGELVDLSERHRVSVRDALQAGVENAVEQLAGAFREAAGHPARGADTSLLDESLVVIYRVLFLLFAEARGLVPVWHPVYRDSYTIESLRPHLDGNGGGSLWDALQAISRLAHRGCRAGTLRMPAFNGRLFSPASAPLAESSVLAERPVRAALRSLTTRQTGRGRARVSFADLGVEHLGGVYERVLDFEIDDGRLVRGQRRKATGSFYTPRSLTEYLVRRTLAPLVAEASPEQILDLRILDPAMGSGAFLVAACRYLATAYEAALVRDGGVTTADLTEADRAGFRRIVAQRTLFGVDLNPMAVQLARLSLWLATLSAGRPLSFLDHHLRAGNSLVGARIDDVRRVRSGRATGRERALPLLDDCLEEEVGGGALDGVRLATGPEETVEQVRAKEALFARLQGPDAPLAKWRRIADLWCAGWFGGPAARPGEIEALIETLSGPRGMLPESAAARLLERVASIARRERFFHWELEFPEVFAPAGGARPAGFDAILGNPPWEMLRSDSAGSARNTVRFTRTSGIYQLQGHGHANAFQMFVERALALVRRGGRVGLILPGGFATDHGCATLRRQVLERTAIDSLVFAENREALFPIHRGLKLAFLTLTRSGEPTTALPLRTGIHGAAQFDRLPDTGVDPEAVQVPPSLIARMSGEQAVIPDLRRPKDVEIVARITFSLPPASSEEGWGLKFGRELNATDDREHFRTAGRGLPVLEGKHLRPFRADAAAAAARIAHGVAARLLPGRPFDRPRIGYRDVASSGNRLTLIAAVLPEGTVTTHTIFCLKTPLDLDAQYFVAGMMNSYVANYLVRMRVSTHVTVATIESLPLPKPPHQSGSYLEVVSLARDLHLGPDDEGRLARLNGLAARLYGLSGVDFEHVLATFPLVDPEARMAARRAYDRTL